jgi:hypothetical protein
MKLIIKDPRFGQMTWDIPPKLEGLIGASADTIEVLVGELSQNAELGQKTAGSMEGTVIEIFSEQIASFLEIIARTHLAAEYAEPPSKFSRQLDARLADIKKDFESQGIR